jgi:hypothetical protein
MFSVPILMAAFDLRMILVFNVVCRVIFKPLLIEFTPHALVTYRTVPPKDEKRL